MGRIENNKRLDSCSRKAVIIIAFLLLLFLVFGTIHTWVSFKPRADRISAELADMNERMDEILEALHDD